MRNCREFLKFTHRISDKKKKMKRLRIVPILRPLAAARLKNADLNTPIDGIIGLARVRSDCTCREHECDSEIAGKYEYVIFFSFYYNIVYYL